MLKHLFLGFFVLLISSSLYAEFMEEGDRCPYYKEVWYSNGEAYHHESEPYPTDLNCIKLRMQGTTGCYIVGYKQCPKNVSENLLGETRVTYYEKLSCGEHKNPLSGKLQEFERCEVGWTNK